MKTFCLREYSSLILFGIFYYILYTDFYHFQNHLTIIRSILALYEIVIKKGNSPKILRIKNVNFISSPKPNMCFPPSKLLCSQQYSDFPEQPQLLTSPLPCRLICSNKFPGWQRNYIQCDHHHSRPSQIWIPM